MYDIICYKFDKKDNNKLENLCNNFEKCTLKNKNMEPDYWFIYLISMNDSIENICGYFKNTDKKLPIHIMNNMCYE